MSGNSIKKVAPMPDSKQKEAEGHRTGVIAFCMAHPKAAIITVVLLSVGVVLISAVSAGVTAYVVHKDDSAWMEELSSRADDILSRKFEEYKQSLENETVLKLQEQIDKLTTSTRLGFTQVEDEIRQVRDESLASLQTIKQELELKIDQLKTITRANFSTQQEALQTVSAELRGEINQLEMATSNKFTQVEATVSQLNNTLQESTSALWEDLNRLNSTVDTHYTENDIKVSEIHQNLSKLISANKEDISQLTSNLTSTAERLYMQQDRFAMETRSNFTRVEELARQACNDATETLNRRLDAQNMAISHLNTTVNSYQRNAATTLHTSNNLMWSMIATCICVCVFVLY